VSALRIGADHDRLAAQIRVVPRLDGGVKGVHVHMPDDPHVVIFPAEG